MDIVRADGTLVTNVEDMPDKEADPHAYWEWALSNVNMTSAELAERAAFQRHHATRRFEGP